MSAIIYKSKPEEITKKDKANRKLLRKQIPSGLSEDTEDLKKDT